MRSAGTRIRRAHCSSRQWVLAGAPHQRVAPPELLPVVVTSASCLPAPGRVNLAGTLAMPICSPSTAPVRRRPAAWQRLRRQSRLLRPCRPDGAAEYPSDCDRIEVREAERRPDRVTATTSTLNTQQSGVSLEGPPMQCRHHTGGTDRNLRYPYGLKRARCRRALAAHRR